MHLLLFYCPIMQKASFFSLLLVPRHCQYCTPYTYTANSSLCRSSSSWAMLNWNLGAGGVERIWMPKIRGSYSKVTFQGARGLAIRQRSHGRTFTHCLSSRVSSNRHAASQEVSACRKTVRSNTEPWPKFPFEILTQTGSIPVHGFAHLGSKANSGHLTPSCYTHKPAIPRLWW